MISLSGIVYSKSVRIAGDEMDEAIVQYIRKQYNLLVGDRRAEEIKIKLGSAYPTGGERLTTEVKGRDLIDGIPKTIVVTDEEVVEGKHNDKYKYYPAFVEDVPDPNALLIPCGKTGCEPLTHPKS